MEKPILLRIDDKLHDTIREVAKARGQDMSNFLREIIKAELARLSFLTPLEKKALGVLQETPRAAEKGRPKK
jgi:hypothetical protein